MAGGIGVTHQQAAAGSSANAAAIHLRRRRLSTSLQFQPRSSATPALLSQYQQQLQRRATCAFRRLQRHAACTGSAVCIFSDSVASARAVQQQQQQHYGNLPSWSFAALYAYADSSRNFEIWRQRHTALHVCAAAERATVLRASVAAAFPLIVGDSSACRHSCRSFNLQRQYQ